MERNGHQRPIDAGAEVLGVEKKGQPQGLMALVRSCDENGHYEAEKIIVGPMGVPVAVAGRSAFVDAEELVEMITARVIEELDKRLFPKA